MTTDRARRPADGVRAVYDAVAAPDAAGGYGIAHLKLWYPADLDSGAADTQMGVPRPDPARGRMPLAVIHPNFNVGPEHYAWLARRLAAAGIVAVTFTYVVGDLHGQRVAASTGIDPAVVSPDEPSPVAAVHPLLGPMLERLADHPEVPIDAGRVVLLGHSAGGTLALLASDPAQVSGLRGCASYAGHTRAQMPQGFGADAYLPVPGRCPLLLAGGTHDGIVGAIAAAQAGQSTAGGHPMVTTFERGVPAECSADLVLVDGADHYSLCADYDAVTGRGYLEAPGPADPAQVRQFLGDLLVAFALDVTDGPAWQRPTDHALVSTWERRVAP